MKIFSIDTSSKNCSISIVEVFNSNSNVDFNIISYMNSNDERTHSQKLMPMVEEMFNKSKLTLDDIDLLSVCVGPGSFTGIRIGIATVKAFCDSKNIPAVGITSLESLAYNVSDYGNIFSLIDAKNENVYAAGFNHSNAEYNLILDNSASNVSNVLDNISNLVHLGDSLIFVGDGSINYKSLITQKFDNYHIAFCNFNEQSAISLAKCTYNKYIHGNLENYSSLSPIYLRKSQAERIADGESI